MRRIVCLGPGPMFKGGISNYNTSLAKALDKEKDTEVHIVSWTEQYPRIIPRKFEDTSSKQDLLAGHDIQVHYLLDFNKKSTWKQTVKKILELQADMVIIQWSIALQGIPLGYIVRKLKKHRQIEVIGDLHFIIQKEGSVLDNPLTKRTLRNMGTYITHSLKTFEELEILFKKPFTLAQKNGARKINNQETINLFHPVYDLFQEDPNFDVDGFKKEIGLKENVFLFFGFIRKYKGLHDVIKAFKLLEEQRDDVSLLICGEEFWNTVDNKKLSVKLKKMVFGFAKKLFLRTKNDEKDYKPLALIDELGVKNAKVFSEFIPNEDVHKYFQVADNILLFYQYATPSGVESLSYNFRLPTLATKVGHFPETVDDGVNGYLAEAEDVNSMCEVMNKAIVKPINREEIVKKAKEMSWATYAQAILNPYE